MYSIEAESLTKKFGRFTAVDDVSFAVKEGEIFGFLGANGAGKSTTIRMLCGLLNPTSGDANVNGISVKKYPDKVKQSIGYMSQKFSLYNDLTVSENISFFGGVYGLESKKLSERKKWVLKIANLEGKENILTGSLPGGIKQRLALGTSVIHQPPIIFLDEPTSGVDPISRRSFWELINWLSDQGTTVLVTTHYLEEAEFCNNIVLIDAGKIKATGTPQELKTNYLSNPIIEVECDKVIDALELFEKQPFVEEISIFGNKIHLIVNDKYENPEQLSSLLKNAQIIPGKIHKIIPTLEDVFIHLLEKDIK